MKRGQERDISRPTSEQYARELRRREVATEAFKAVVRTIKTLIVFAAAAVLIATLLFPTIQVQRGSMSPTLKDGEHLIFITVGNIRRGDIVAFHLGNQTMVKRVIATSGQYVDIKADGSVYINGEPAAEPYLSGASFGECDIEFPFQVPDKHFFVMGDNRGVSMDSRLREFGTIHQEEIIGKSVIRVWPLTRIGFVK